MCPFRAGKPRSAHSTPGEVSPVLGGAEGYSYTLSFHGRHTYSLTAVVDEESMKFKNDGICNQGIEVF